MDIVSLTQNNSSPENRRCWKGDTFVIITFTVLLSLLQIRQNNTIYSQVYIKYQAISFFDVKISPSRHDRSNSDSFIHSSYGVKKNDSRYTPSQQCRLEIEKWLNPIIDEFVQMGEEMPPLIDWVWDMETYFVVNMRLNRAPRWWNHRAFTTATWNWQDQLGNNFTIDGILGANDRGMGIEKTIILPFFNIPPRIVNQTERSIPTFLWMSEINVPSGKTVRPWIYDLRPFIRCDRIETQTERPRPGTRIGMCVRFWGNHHLLPPFIAYHRLIGVQHFWFYASEEFNITDLPVSPDVTYVPYRFVWSEHKNKSRWNYGKGVVGPWKLQYNGESFWQPTAMQQCLYRSKRYGLDWIMANDIDEYLWINKTESTRDTTDIQNSSILQHFLKEYESIPDLGGLAVDGWAFGANDTGQDELQLPIDYSYRTNVVQGGRRKIIYRVPNAKRIHVHWLHEGGHLIVLPVSDIRWNHYRTPHMGIYQRGKNEIVRDSSLPDTYRASILKSIQQDVYPTLG